MKKHKTQCEECLQLDAREILYGDGYQKKPIWTCLIEWKTIGKVAVFIVADL